MWFRRDLRVRDHAALLGAAAESRASGAPLAPVFVLDPALLGPSGANRVAFLLRSLGALRASGVPLVVRTGDPCVELPALARATGATTVHCTADFAPYGAARDMRVRDALDALGVALVAHDSPYAVAPGSLRNQSGTGYRVFTPFHRAWAEQVRGMRPLGPLDVGATPWLEAPSPGALPTEPHGVAPRLPEAGEDAAHARWEHFLAHGADTYASRRDRPGDDATSRLSVDLKFGALHPRQLLAALGDPPARSDRWVFRSELAWREFYADVLWHAPASARADFAPAMRGMRTDDGPTADARFGAWCEGRTGFPFIDAGMRQLLAEGWMHNRVRMAVASFLVKDLHLPWQRGAAWFMRHLVDGDLASNQHGWQWTAGTGTDAAPYFRIFNPTSQGRTFDPDGEYVRRWVPELAALADGGADVHEPYAAPVRRRAVAPPQVPAPGLFDAPTGAGGGVGDASSTAAYPAPVVDHAHERGEALARLAELRARRTP